MAHTEGGALVRLRRVNSGGRHNDFKRWHNFGGWQYDRRGRPGNIGGGQPQFNRATLRLHKAAMTSEGGTKTRGWRYDFRGRHYDFRADT